ncbi:MAG: hypothetical protein P1U56_10540 [Saprospiraceae bacterium]|nr:hypothetical protein [Saprospiraceae bacterium]
MFKPIYLLLLVIVFISCNRDPAPIVLNTKFVNSNSVSIDGGPPLQLDVSTDYDRIYLDQGKHTVSINDNPEESFVLGRWGGILNLAHEDFVIMENEFVKESPVNNSTITPMPVLYDSLLIYYRFFSGDQESMVKTLTHRMWEGVFTGGAINSDKLFIKKDWYYFIDEDVPNQISINVPNDWQLHSRTKVVTANEFLAFATLSEDYTVAPLEVEELREVLQSKER